MKIITYPQNIVCLLRTSVCVQPEEWAASMLPQIRDHIGDFDEEDDFKLDEIGATGLRDFLRGPSFLPFLTALDIDRERVTRREEETLSMVKLEESHDHLLKYHLNKWIEEEANLDPADYDSTKIPSPALPIKDMVLLKNDLMPKAAIVGDITPGNIYALALYAQLTNLKVNALLDIVTAQGLVAKDSSPGWEDMLLKFPFLSQCDDHVKNVPRGTPLQLSRTRAVSTRTIPSPTPHRRLLFARNFLMNML